MVREATERLCEADTIGESVEALTAYQSVARLVSAVAGADMSVAESIHIDAYRESSAVLN